MCLQLLHKPGSTCSAISMTGNGDAPRAGNFQALDRPPMFLSGCGEAALLRNMPAALPASLQLHQQVFYYEFNVSARFFFAGRE
jgi:hypothetical protein